MIDRLREQSIYLDTANLKEVKRWSDLGVIDGVTTNQSIMAQEGVSVSEIPSLVKTICATVAPKSVSVELSSSKAPLEEMLEEAKKWKDLGENITLKVPVIPGSTKTLDAIQALKEMGVSLNITAITRFGQSLLPIVALRDYHMPSFVSIFGGRSTEQYWRFIVPSEQTAENTLRTQLKEAGNNDADIQTRVNETVKSSVNSSPVNIIRETAEFIRKGNERNRNLRLIVGSIRNATAVEEFFAAGADIVTIPPKILLQILDSDRTRQTNNEFDGKWEEIVAREKAGILEPSKI
ncbi:MAG: hypothetical protein M1142_00170 [Patescibacteria group bacterium]|nr:hypothetical protein [Patescibacteria group bacterium]